MPSIDTVTSRDCFRTDRTSEAPSKVDRKANIVFGAALMQAGDLNDPRPWSVDAKTLDQAASYANKSKNGLKARFTHPNMSSDGMGSYLGRWKNVHVDSDVLRGDLHISDAAFSSPKGDLGTYVMDLAESDPEAFGVSLATKLDMGDLDTWERDRSNDKPERWPVRFDSVRAADVVDEPAATRGGFFDVSLPDLRSLPAQATLLLDTYFGDSEPDVIRGRIDSFLEKYFRSKKGQNMAEATQGVLETDSVSATETQVTEGTPVAETSAAGGTVEQTSSTEDFAAGERERCKKIRALCSLAGLEDKFNQFVDAGFTVSETTEAIKAIQGKKSSSLSQDVDVQTADPDAAVKSEFAEISKFGLAMGMTESEYVKHARRRA